MADKEENSPIMAVWDGEWGMGHTSSGGQTHEKRIHLFLLLRERIIRRLCFLTKICLFIRLFVLKNSHIL